MTAHLTAIHRLPRRRWHRVRFAWSCRCGASGSGRRGLTSRQARVDASLHADPPGWSSFLRGHENALR